MKNSSHFKYYILGVLTVIIAISVYTCKHDPITLPEHIRPGTGNTGYTPIYGSSGDTIKDSICFSEEILPLILSNCAKSGCHDAVATSSGVPLTNFAQIRSRTTPGNPNNSLLYQVLFQTPPDNMPPTGNPALTTAQIQLIHDWIAQGSKQNIDCGMSCDTNVFTYSGAIGLIMQNNCKGCHSGSAPGGGVSIQNYSDALVIVNNGKLWGSINHLSGYYGMPLNAPMLSDCRLKQIKKWIDSGAPNN